MSGFDVAVGDEPAGLHAAWKAALLYRCICSSPCVDNLPGPMGEAEAAFVRTRRVEPVAGPTGG